MTTAVTEPATVGPRWEWGDRLRKIRRSVANLSQPQMAAMIGVRATTYAAWEAGRTVPSHRIAHAVAQRIENQYPGQVSAAWVLGVGGENTTADEDLLPRMDSNHQPCDLRPECSICADQPAFCDVNDISLETTCESEVGMNDYQSRHTDGKQCHGVLPLAIGSWGGLSL